MPSKQLKKAGTRFELRVKDHFEYKGWKVFRSAGSKSCADLIAFKNGQKPLWIQCKASEDPQISKKDKYDLHMGQKFMDIQALIVGRENRTWQFKYYGLVGTKLVELLEILEW